jgi:hypothetical protein
MEHSEQIELLATALNKVQQTELFALTDKENPFFKSKYADLSSVWSVARKPLTENGLSVSQTMDKGSNGDPVIITTLFHNSGQWLRGRLEIPAPKKDPQSFGAAITYGRRYSLAAILGICPEDDDAESAMKRNNNSKKKASKPAPKKETKTQKGDDAATQAQYKKLYAMLKNNGFEDDDVELFKDFLKDKYQVEYLTKKKISLTFDVFDKAVDSFFEWEKGRAGLQDPQDDEPPQHGPDNPPPPDDDDIPF